jgi:hypothetical protein
VCHSIKMTDALANLAMDCRTSSQVLHPSAHPGHCGLRAYLGNDLDLSIAAASSLSCCRALRHALNMLLCTSIRAMTFGRGLPTLSTAVPAALLSPTPQKLLGTSIERVRLHYQHSGLPFGIVHRFCVTHSYIFTDPTINHHNT